MAIFSTPEQRLAQQQAALDRAEKDPTARTTTSGATSSAPAAARQLAAGTVAGTALRTGVMGGAVAGRQMVSRVASTAAAAADRGTAPIRGALGFARDAGRALTGMPAAPNAGQPVGLPSLPEPVSYAPTLEPGSAAPRRYIRPSTTVAASAPRADFSDVSARTLATAAAPAGGITRGVDARGNRVYSDSDAGLAEGITLANGGMGTGRAAPAGGYAGIPRALPGASAAAAPEIAVAQQGQRVLSTAVPMAPVVGRQGAVIQNPGDTTADKLQRALTSYSVKGSPSTRAAIAQAILGEAGARQNERMQTLRTQDQAALEAQRANAAAAEGNASRQLDADKFNVSAQDSREYRRQMIDLERSRPFQVGQGEDGAQGIVRSDGSYTPITDASGAPVRVNQRGQALSPDALLKSYTDQANAISNGMGTAEEKRAARAELDANPMFAPILGSRKVNNMTPSRDQFLEQARKANPGVGDAELIAYYEKTYGS